MQRVAGAVKALREEIDSRIVPALALNLDGGDITEKAHAGRLSDFTHLLRIGVRKGDLAIRIAFTHWQVKIKPLEPSRRSTFTVVRLDFLLRFKISCQDSDDILKRRYRKFFGGSKMLVKSLVLTPSRSIAHLTIGIALATAFAVLTAISAVVAIPVGPVPITLQTLIVILAGLVLGSRLGALSQIEYVVAGLAGAPIFAQGKSGIIAATGPTFGYIVGFGVAAFVAGLVVERMGTPTRLVAFVAAVVGALVVYLFGAGWLAGWYGIAKQASLEESLVYGWQFGVIPFVAGDLVKAFVAASVAESGRSIAAFLYHR